MKTKISSRESCYKTIVETLAGIKQMKEKLERAALIECEDTYSLRVYNDLALEVSKLNEYAQDAQDYLHEIDKNESGQSVYFRKYGNLR